MSTRITSRIQVVEDDITRFQIDAIVNAANESLLEKLKMQLPPQPPPRLRAGMVELADTRTREIV